MRYNKILNDQYKFIIGYRLGIIVLPSDTLPVSSTWSYYTNGRLFSRIEFRDRNTNGTGGQVRILDGGIGSDFFSFRIDSIGVGFGIDTHVTFYVQADIQLTVGTLADRSVLMTTYESSIHLTFFLSK